MVADAQTRLYPLCGKPVAEGLSGEGGAPKAIQTQALRANPVGHRVQIDVKVIQCTGIVGSELKLYQHTAIDEYSRHRVLGAYLEFSADFLRKVVATFVRKGVKMEYIQTVNSFEFINRFPNSKLDLSTQFESTAPEMFIRHNSKFERSHREVRKPFIAPAASSPFPTLVGS